MIKVLINQELKDPDPDMMKELVLRVKNDVISAIKSDETDLFDRIAETDENLEAVEDRSHIEKWRFEEEIPNRKRKEYRVFDFVKEIFDSKMPKFFPDIEGEIIRVSVIYIYYIYIYILINISCTCFVRIIILRYFTCITQNVTQPDFP
jgi:hypothetical protein